MSAVRGLTAARPSLADYLVLTKPRIAVFVVLTAATGWFLATPVPAAAPLLHLALGTLLVAGGTGTLNQVVERDTDRLMRRTAGRPLPAGRVARGPASLFGWVLSAAGIGWLAAFVTPVTAVLAAVTLILYLWAYTPLKRRSAVAILVGAVPGALPVVGGWAAGGGTAGPEVWALFWILFLWQLPHFLALAWLYREDYARAGMPLVAAGDTDGRLTFGQAALYATALIPVSLLPSVLGMSGWLYFVAAAVLGTWYAAAGLAAALERSVPGARRLFAASIVYLPAVLAALMLDRIV